LTAYNASAAAKEKGLPSKGATSYRAGVEDFNPYSNLCGLLALREVDASILDSLFMAIQTAAVVSAPAYD
jgi:hypothetical protein